VSYVQNYKRSLRGLGAISMAAVKTVAKPVAVQQPRVVTPAPVVVKPTVTPVVVKPTVTPVVVQQPRVVTPAPPLTLPPVVVQTLPPIVKAPVVAPPVVQQPRVVTAPPLSLPPVIVQTLPPIVSAPPKPLVQVPSPPKPTVPLTLPPVVAQTLPPIVKAPVVMTAPAPAPVATPFISTPDPIRTIIQPAPGSTTMAIKTAPAPSPPIYQQPRTVIPATVKPVVAATKDAATQIASGAVKPGTLAATIVATAAQITGTAPNSTTLATAVKNAATQIDAGTVKPGTFASVVQEAAVIKGAQAPLVKPITVSVKPASPPQVPTPIIKILNEDGIRQVTDLPGRNNPAPLTLPNTVLPPKQLTIQNPTPPVLIKPTVKDALLNMQSDTVVKTPAGPVVVPAVQSSPAPAPAEDIQVVVPPAVKQAAKGGIPGWAWLLGGAGLLYAMTKK
jgi:hypothetical protein